MVEAEKGMRVIDQVGGSCCAETLHHLQSLVKLPLPRLDLQQSIPLDLPKVLAIVQVQLS